MLGAMAMMRVTIVMEKTCNAEKTQISLCMNTECYILL